MSTPVTKAHIELAETALFSRDKAGRLLTAPMAAQLIADSEAKATEQANAQVESLLLSAKNAIPASEHPAEPTVENWAWQIRNLGDDRRLVYAERDQLRAEVERLKKQIKDDNLSYGCELRDPYGTIWEQATKDHDRAGKAERALAELREWQAGVIANERLHHAERKDAIARAESAESQLHALRLICGTTDADKFSTWVDRANARAEEAEHDCRVLIVQLNVAKDERAAERARLDYILRTCAAGVFYNAESRDAIDAEMKEENK